MKIRVLEILATLKRAGAERLAVSLARRLDPERFETGVVSLYNAYPGGLEPELEAVGARVWHLGKKPALDVNMIPRLRRVFHEFRPAVIHTHSYVLRYALPAATGMPAVALVHSVHNLAMRENDLTGRSIQRLVFGRRVAAVAVGEEVRRSFVDFYGAEPAATIRNGVDTAACRRPEARQSWRQAHGFGDREFLVVSVGRLEEQKNPLGLIDAFAAAFPEGPAHLVLAGDGSLRGEARAWAERKGVGGRVHFLGVLAGAAELLAAGDVFALASDWEGTPLAVMEAAAAGLPVVATSVGGVPELVADGETGLLVPPGEAAQLAGALARLAGDADLRSRMSEAALRRAPEFDLSGMVAGYAALFERLARGRR